MLRRRMEDLCSTHSRGLVRLKMNERLGERKGDVEHSKIVGCWIILVKKLLSTRHRHGCGEAGLDFSRDRCMILGTKEGGRVKIKRKFSALFLAIAWNIFRWGYGVIFRTMPPIREVTFA